VLADVEQQVLALRAIHAKLRDLDAGENFGDVVAPGRRRQPRKLPETNERWLRAGR